MQSSKEMTIRKTAQERIVSPLRQDARWMEKNMHSVCLMLGSMQNLGPVNHCLVTGLEKTNYHALQHLLGCAVSDFEVPTFPQQGAR